MDKDYEQLLEVKKRAQIDLKDMDGLVLREKLEIGKKNIEKMPYSGAFKEFYLANLLFPDNDKFLYYYHEYENQIIKMADDFGISGVYVCLKLAEIQLEKEYIVKEKTTLSK
ncbi:MAG TPA: hypothetical protein PLV83_01170 [Bacilli bacterium]|nr:hypothetical protein [Bacilli bacterium]